METLLTIISILYAITGIISVIGYIPTIRDLIKKRASANIQSYIIWVICAFISLIYAHFVISDLLLEIVIGLSLGCIIIILVLALKLKYSK